MKITSRSMLCTITIVGLVLLPGCGRKAAEEAGHAEEEAGHEHAAEASVTLTPEAIAAAGIRTEPAALRSLQRRITAPGELDFNARRLSHLTARTSGRVERVLAVAGDRVAAGQVLAEVHSPDFMSLQAEYLQAAERARRHNADPADAESARVILESARARLALVGASAAEVDTLAAERVPRPLLRVRAPFAGTVSEAGIVAGDHVETGASLFRLADLSILWANLQIKEKDLASLRAGSAVELRAQAYPGETFRGKLLLVGDVVDERTRTVIARVEVANPEARLKAGMYVDAVLDGGGARTVLAVPEEAVQEDEGRTIVFVLTGAGSFARREVETGERFPGLVEIRRGLAAGEAVVSAGGFLLKSEMRKGSLEDEHGHS